MIDSRVSRIVAGLVLLTGTILGTGGCNSNMPQNGNDPPEIPPAETFVMDFSAFSGDGAAKLIPGRIDPTTMQVLPGANWGWAALNVGAWNVIITVGLAVPVAAFLESFHHEPEAQADGMWLWSYDVNVGGTIYSAALYAAAVEGGTEWNMYISQEGGYTDFNWFSGFSNFTGTAGTWTLNKDPESLTPFVEIEWTRDAEGQTGDIRYTNVEPDGDNNGSYITYAASEGAFDASFELLNNNANNLTTIEWDRTTRDGRVKDPAHFSDDAWHCWDSDLQNTACP